MPEELRKPADKAKSMSTKPVGTPRRRRGLRTTLISLGSLIAVVVTFLGVTRVAQENTGTIPADQMRNTGNSLMSTIIYGALEIHSVVAPLTLASIERSNAPLTLKKSYPDVSVRRIETAEIQSVVVCGRNANLKHLIYYIHGGAWAAGLDNRYLSFAITLSRKTGFCVALPEFGRLPRNHYPTALDQLVSAYRSLLASTRPAKVVFGGDSSGANLSAALIFLLEQKRLPLPSVQFLFSPLVDLTLDSPTFASRASSDPMNSMTLVHDAVKAYVDGETPLTNPLVSPIYGDFHGYPPTIIEVGSQEIFLGDSMKLYAKIKADGGMVELDVWRGMWHAFPIVVNVPESKQALNLVTTYVNKND